MLARYIVGDVRAVLASMPKQSVDLVLTSPPFFNLRSYLSPDDEHKQLEIGQEATPGEFIDTLLDIVEQCAEVLAPHGSMCFELGDSYSGSGGAGGDYAEGGMRAGQPTYGGRHPGAMPESKRFTGDRPGMPLDRSLCLVPEIFRFSLVYGFNPLTGRQTPRWRARNVIRWCRPNPPVGALGDKVRPATSEMVVVCKDRRYFDLEAVRTEFKGVNAESQAGGWAVTPTSKDRQGIGKCQTTNDHSAYGHPAGAPPLDYWVIPTQPYKGSHYATWPAKLCEIPIESMCPRNVCTECGKPSTRIIEQTEEYAEFRASKNALGNAEAGSRANVARCRDGGVVADDAYAGFSNLDDSAARGEKYVTTGWTDCCCGPDCQAPTFNEVPYPATYRDDGKLIAEAGILKVMTDPGNCDGSHWRTGIVLDPFAGSGTTLQVATGHGRDAIGIDLDEHNAELATERVGPLFLTVERSKSSLTLEPDAR